MLKHARHAPERSEWERTTAFSHGYRPTGKQAVVGLSIITLIALAIIAREPISPDLLMLEAVGDDTGEPKHGSLVSVADVWPGSAAGGAAANRTTTTSTSPSNRTTPGVSNRRRR